MRLIQVTELLDDLRKISYSKLDLICKYGCAGGSGHSEYMQMPKVGPEGDDDDSDLDNDTEAVTDSNLFLFSLVSLHLVASTDHKIETLWENLRPSSTCFCHPIKFRYMKETLESIRKEVENVKDEISKLRPYEFLINGKSVIIKFSLQLTTVDGKVFNALTHSSSQSCYICRCKPTQMNDLSNLKRFPINEDSFQYGLSSLHGWIKCLECVLHIAYKLDLQALTI